MIPGNTYIGRVNQDVEMKQVGQDKKNVLKVSLYLGGKKPNAAYLNVTLWDPEATEYAGLVKGDYVMCAGVPEPWVGKNGQTYYDMTAIWTRPLHPIKHTQPARVSTAPPPIDDSESLPF